MNSYKRKLKFKKMTFVKKKKTIPGLVSFSIYISILYPKCRMNSKNRIQQCNVDSPKARACSLHTFSLIISRLGKTNITRLC